MQSESQWQFLGYCIHCGCPIYGVGEERRYMGANNCNCELKRMTAKDNLLEATEEAMAIARCLGIPTVLRRLNEQLGKIKSMAKDIEENDERTRKSI